MRAPLTKSYVRACVSGVCTYYMGYMGMGTHRPTLEHAYFICIWHRKTTTTMARRRGTRNTLAQGRRVVYCVCVLNQYVLTSVRVRVCISVLASAPDFADLDIARPSNPRTLYVQNEHTFARNACHGLVGHIIPYTIYSTHTLYVQNVPNYFNYKINATKPRYY